MRYKLLIATLLISMVSYGQRKKFTGGNVATIKDAPTVVTDTLSLKLDTTKVQFRLWIGIGYESYLARVNGFIVNRTQVGKMMMGNREQLLFDDKWKPIKPEDIDPNIPPVKMNW
jgi:hypothetical protein